MLRRRCASILIQTSICPLWTAVPCRCCCTAFPAQPPAAYLCPARPTLRRGGFAPEIAGCEDWDLWLRLALDGVPWQTVNYAGALYRRHAGSVSTHATKMLQSKIDVLLRAERAIVTDGARLGRLGPELLSVRARRAS